MICHIGVIVCGGRGKRLKNLTKKTQKCLLKVANIPIIMYVIKALIVAGCKDIYFITGYKSFQIEKYFGDGKKYGFIAHYINPNAKGTAQALSSLADDIKEPFVYSHGNIIYNLSLVKNLLRFHQKGSIATLALAIKDLGRTHAYALVDDSRVVDLEIPGLTTVSGNGFCCMGVSVFTPEIFEYLIKVRPSGMVEEGVKAAIKDGKVVRGYKYRYDWFHLQIPQDFYSLEGLNIRKIIGGGFSNFF